jgi:hypothetical protein
VIAKHSTILAHTKGTVVQSIAVLLKIVPWKLYVALALEVGSIANNQSTTGANIELEKSTISSAPALISIL